MTEEIAPCIDLRTLKDFVVRGDGSYDPREAEYVWSLEIPCKFGIIYPWGHEFLVACCEGHGRIAGKFKRMGLEMVQYNASFKFHVDKLPEIQKIMGARRRRTLTPEQRAKAAERLAQFKFKPTVPK